MVLAVQYGRYNYVSRRPERRNENTMKNEETILKLHKRIYVYVEQAKQVYMKSMELLKQPNNNKIENIKRDLIHNSIKM